MSCRTRPRPGPRRRRLGDHGKIIRPLNRRLRSCEFLEERTGWTDHLGRIASPGWAGAMVTYHFGTWAERTSRVSRIFISSLLRRAPVLYVSRTRYTEGCLPA